MTFKWNSHPQIKPQVWVVDRAYRERNIRKTIRHLFARFFRLLKFFSLFYPTCFLRKIENIYQTYPCIGWNILWITQSLTRLSHYKHFLLCYGEKCGKIWIFRDDSADKCNAYLIFLSLWLVQIFCQNTTMIVQIGFCELVFFEGCVKANIMGGFRSISLR